MSNAIVAQHQAADQLHPILGRLGWDSLPLHEPGKEFHLEVILKATAFGYRIHEIPAMLEWKDYKHQGKRMARKSSTRVKRLIVSHSLFSLFANPVRYVWGLSFLALLASVVFLAFAVAFYFSGQVAAFTAIVSLLLLIVAFSLFVMGVILKQGNMIQRELWALQSRLMLRAADAREPMPGREDAARDPDKMSG